MPKKSKAVLEAEAKLAARKARKALKDKERRQRIKDEEQSYQDYMTAMEAIRAEETAQKIASEQNNESKCETYHNLGDAIDRQVIQAAARDIIAGFAVTPEQRQEYEAGKIIRVDGYEIQKVQDPVAFCTYNPKPKPKIWQRIWSKLRGVK